MRDVRSQREKGEGRERRVPHTWKDKRALGANRRTEEMQGEGTNTQADRHKGGGRLTRGKTTQADTHTHTDLHEAAGRNHRSSIHEHNEPGVFIISSLGGDLGG